MPQKFADNFKVNADDMFCIRIPADIHNKITGKFNSNDYGLNDKNKTYSREFIRQQTMKIYMDLYNETGDNVYEYMYLFIKFFREEDFQCFVVNGFAEVVANAVKSHIVK